VQFVNFQILSRTQCRNRIARAGQPVDIGYVASLGPQAIPAIDRYIAAQATSEPTALAYRNYLAFSHDKRAGDWRAWTFRDWRLTRYLNDHTIGGLTRP
jgi:hypothetical protein